MIKNQFTMKKCARRQKSLINKLWLSLGIFCFLSLNPTFAQDTPSGPWGLEDCIQYALKNNVLVRQNDLRVQINENNFLQSRVSRLPSVNATANQRIAWGRSIDPFSNSFVNEQVNSNDFGLFGNVTLFNGGSINNTIKRNQVDVNASRATAQQTRNDISLNVALAYLNVLLNQELLTVAEQNVVSSENQLERNEKLFAAGAIAENDVIDARAQVANNQLAVVNAENQIRVSKANLQQWMNLPVTESFEIQTVPIEALEVAEFAETPSQIYQTAEVTQPSVKAADLNAESATYGVDVARAGFYPTLSLSGTVLTGFSSATPRRSFRRFAGIDTLGFVNGDPALPVTEEFDFTTTVTSDEYPFFDQLGDNLRQSVTLTLDIPIFNRWQVKNDVNNARINQQISELNAQDVRNQLRNDIENAYVNAKAAIQTYRSQEQQLQALQLSFETTQKRYEAGAANIVDFNIAQIALNNAQSDLVRAKYDYLFRRKVLDFYQGKDLSIK